MLNAFTKQFGKQNNDEHLVLLKLLLFIIQAITPKVDCFWNVQMN